MDGILVQDSDWNAKLSASLAELLEKKLLCDLGIVCGVQNDVNNLKTNEVVMVHRCILAGASETIRKLSIGGQVYNLVKINGIDISPQCWNNVLEFVYKAKTEVIGKDLCDVRKASQVLQIKPLEKAVDVHHSNLSNCVCGKKKEEAIELNSSNTNETDGSIFTVSDSSWLVTLFEGMLDLLVKQSLCNMTIITEKPEKAAAEILAHLCMLVASSSTIKELVLQGTETYNSVKIDSITYNTWLYLLEYVYTSRVSIVKSNIPEVWIASQLLQIDGLANAVAPFASQMGAVIPGQLQAGPNKSVDEIADDSSEQSNEILQSDFKKETMLSQVDSQSSSVSGISSPPTTPTDLNGVKSEKDITVEISQDHFTADACSTQNMFLQDPSSNNNSGGFIVPVSFDQSSMTPVSVDDNGQVKGILSVTSSNGAVDTGGQLLINQVIQPGTAGVTTTTALPSPIVNVNLAGLTTDSLAVAGLSHSVGQQFLVPEGVSAGGLASLQVAAGNGSISGAGQIVNTIQPDGSTAMIWVPSQMLPVINSDQLQQAITQVVKPESAVSLIATKSDGNSGINIADNSSNQEGEQQSEKLQSVENKESTSDGNVDNTCLYFCNKCAHVFSQKAFLEKHKCVQTNDVNNDAKSPTNQISSEMNKLMCKYCNKIFSRTWTLNVHLRTHTGERPYKCKFCNKAFSDKSNMRQHSLIHTSRKEYNCPKCNQAFAQKRYMKKHYMETCRRKFTSGKQQPALQTQQSSVKYIMKYSNDQITYKQISELDASEEGDSDMTAVAVADRGGSGDATATVIVGSRSAGIASSSSSGENSIKYDIDLGKQSVDTVKSNSGSSDIVHIGSTPVVDSVDTSNSGSAWDTSIMMTQGSPDGHEDDESNINNIEDVDNDDGIHGDGSESELGEISLGGSSTGHQSDDGGNNGDGNTVSTEDIKLFCKNCKKTFKNERQKNSHRCLEF